jgi:hypothetical protein
VKSVESATYDKLAVEDRLWRKLGADGGLDVGEAPVMSVAIAPGCLHEVARA